MKGEAVSTTAMKGAWDVTVGGPTLYLTESDTTHRAKVISAGCLEGPMVSPPRCMLRVACPRALVEAAHFRGRLSPCDASKSCAVMTHSPATVAASQN